MRNQIERTAKTTGYHALAASELEYFMFENSYRDAFAKGYRTKALRAVGDFVEDYHLLQSARTEKYNAPFRRYLRESGVPVENSKGEAAVGQHELNVKYSDVLQMGDRHVVYKQCLKEVADKQGVSLTFMAKPFHDRSGSGCHIHLSLHEADGKNVFPGDETLGPVKCSPVFKQFLAGWLKYTPDVMVFHSHATSPY
jgi:glutamine synthetase